MENKENNNMIMENMIMEKQFIISCFPLPDEIQDHMKGFLFLDEFQAKVLKNRKEVSKILKDNLYYSCDEDEEINHWALWCVSTQLQAVSCQHCGDFILPTENVANNCFCVCSN
jgi:hypothetical protein